MVRDLLIRCLAILLVVMAISPVCHAIGAMLLHGHDVPEAVTAPAFNISKGPAADAFTPEESCWLQQAHLFEAPSLNHGTVIVLPLILMAILGLGFVVSSSWAHVPFYRKPPWRGPPSRAFLQIFRN